MKVARYYNNDDIRLDEIPKPIIDSGELLVKVKKSGVCGSDVLEYYRFETGSLKTDSKTWEGLYNRMKDLIIMRDEETPIISVS